MAKAKKSRQLPRKGADVVRFVEKNAEVIEKRQEGSHVVMRVRGPEGETLITVNVHGSKDLSLGVWHKTRKALIRIGILIVLLVLLAAVRYFLETS